MHVASLADQAGQKLLRQKTMTQHLPSRSASLRSGDGRRNVIWLGLVVTASEQCRQRCQGKRDQHDDRHDFPDW